MAVSKSLKGNSRTEYTISYPLLRGMDASTGTGCARDRLAYIENMYRDYEGDSGCALESIPGYRPVGGFVGRINGMYYQLLDNEPVRLTVHAADELWSCSFDDGIYDYKKLATLPDKKSTGFNYFGSIYILDGENMHSMTRDGEYSNLSDGTFKAYIPTTYVNGERYEERNMLSNAFTERVTIGSIEEYSFGSPGIRYKIIDSENRLCATYGLDETQTAYTIYIPSYTEIDGVRYKVTEIGEDSFRGCYLMKTVIINEGIHKIGKGAFCDCTALESIYMPSTLATIEDDSFLRCLKLSNIYFGISLTSIAENAFVDTPEAKTIYYGGRKSDFLKIPGSGYVATGSTIKEYYSKKDAYISLPLHSKAKEITRVEIGGINRNFDYTCVNGVVRSLSVTIVDKDTAVGNYAVIHGTYIDECDMAEGISCDSGAAALCGCTIAMEYDGRIFLSGNKNAPGFIFYSEKAQSSNELYFPESNYWREGRCGEVISMLSCMGALIVFVSGDEHGGSIYYHTPESTGLDTVTTIYPVSYIHSGVDSLGPAISFYDDPVFLTRGGLYGIDKQKISLERAISSRSHNINPYLLSEDLSSAIMVKWCGYLAIFLGTKVYLADSRATFLHPSGGYEYEWYMLSEIGAQTGGKRDIYIYSDMKNEYTEVHERVGEIAEGTVYSAMGNDGNIYYYTIENNVKYALYNTGKVVCNGVSPPTAVISINEHQLIFGTERGEILTFNNDKRGVPPSSLLKEDDFNMNEYKKLYGRRIHPSFYSFSGVTPRYAIKLPQDDCSIPYLTKSTVNGSLVLKCTYRGYGQIITEVATDKNGYREISSIMGGGFDFSNLSFDSISLSTTDVMTIPIMEHERGWIEKQIAIYSESYETPIVIHSVSYRYTIKGKIKKQ